MTFCGVCPPVHKHMQQVVNSKALIDLGTVLFFFKVHSPSSVASMAIRDNFIPCTFSC